jgi:putative spermidine/putrescine transport system ATP-binding protein
MQSAAAPMVSFRQVHKSFNGKTPAVRDLSLEVAAGELLTLLGPSGAGKTTLLMLLAGFERPDAGEILVEGRPMAHIPPHQRGIGVVFQHYALFPHLTAAENAAFPLRVRRVGRAEREARVARVLEMVRLEGRRDRFPGQLSSGEQQRVALARALVFDPRLVLLDEPLRALDRPLREEMQFEIRQLQRRLGLTMLYVTHDHAEAVGTSDRIAVLAGGTLRQTGTPQMLYDEPACEFVARILGEDNRLAGRVDTIDEEWATVRLDCGATVEVMAADAEPGEPCVVSVRPERIAVAAVAAEEMGDGALPARVNDVVFHGDHFRLRLAVGVPGAPTTPVTVKRPAGVPLTGLEPGQPAAIAWQPHHARAFRPEPGT